MAQISPLDDVITGVTPLEAGLVDARPRLFFTPENVAGLRERIGREPWSAFMARVKHQAEIGHEPLYGVLHLLTGEREYLARGAAALEKLVSVERPTRFYHLSDTACLYDWLYGDLDEPLRARAREFLDLHGRQCYETMALRRNYHSGLYTCNMCVEQLAEVTTVGCALYGDVPNVGPWLRFAMEKARTLVTSLGPDGASQEGICYGGFYVESLLRVLALVRDVLGWDLHADAAYLENAPWFFLYSALPWRCISPPPSERVPSRDVHLFFGDGVRYPWYGPNFFLRRLASLYRDPHAQWLADVMDKTGASANGVGQFLNLLWYDPTVRPRSPGKLPTLHHFKDKDIVVMRSGWTGRESVFALKCGPHAGHFALNQFRQNIGGGHQAPDAGSFQIFAHGDWLICEGGYARKVTATRNTALVNGVGQTGESYGRSDWFECSELRRERRGPAIVHVESRPRFDHVIGDVAPAYEPQARLTRFLRHVLYVKPDVWVIADELEAEAPSTFTLFFHAHGDEHKTDDRPFIPAGERAWITGGERGKLRITSLAPTDARGSPEVQRIAGVGAHADRDMCILKLENGAPARSALFVTVLEAYPARRAPRADVRLESRRGRFTLTLSEGPRRARFAFVPGQSSPATPAFRPLR